MSIRLMSAVWDLDLPTAEKMVLLVLADHANDDGSEARPGVDTMARKTGLNRRTVQRHLRELSGQGLIAVDRVAAQHRVTVYRVTLQGRQAVTPDGVPEVTPETARGDTDDVQGRSDAALPVPTHPDPPVAAPSSPLPGLEDTRVAEPRVPKPRARDPIFDALTEAWGPRPGALIGRIKRELIATYGGVVTPEEIVARSKEAQRRYDDVSPMVLVSRWPDLVPQGRQDSTGRPRAPGDWDDGYEGRWEDQGEPRGRRVT